MNPTTTVLPPAAAFVLTRRLPCAALLVVMLTAALWLPALLQGIPLLAMLASAVGLGLHVLSPALVALVSFGGGAMFGLNVSGIAALAVYALSGFELLPALVVLSLYGLLPILTANALRRLGGVRRSALLVAIGIGMGVLAALLAGAMSQGVDLQAFVAQQIAPLFAAAQAPQGDADTARMLADAKHLTSLVLPGIAAFGLWMAWWGDVVLARNVARRYGFYRGDVASPLGIAFGKPLAYGFLAMLLLANFAGGNGQYVGINAAIMLAGLLAVQGVAVAHSWLKARDMMLAIGLMYMMLFMWSAVIVPFVIVGLLDIWFDYRRSLNPATGGQ
ncbi:MAG TPA: DUF2232 domain-containing protein [Mariprofundaceae bacterium]|nr:DUF2232 domain-containing protein [Mariprofundaceae bacterium]